MDLYPKAYFRPFHLKLSHNDNHTKNRFIILSDWKRQTNRHAYLGKGYRNYVKFCAPPQPQQKGFKNLQKLI
jgi:hypothetical protein